MIEVVVCETCRHPDGEREKEGRTGGSIMHDALRAALRDEDDLPAVRVEPIRCLMACQRHCTVHIRAPGKMGYVLGGFSPDRDAVRGLVDYIRAYGTATDGVVPFRQWPRAVRGRFIARVPPLPVEP